jgi:arylsulfatase A-like enzyme
MKIMCHQLLVWMVCFQLSSCCMTLSATDEGRKPNILFIMTDQQRASTLQLYGNSKYNVPNLNSLAERSVVFLNTYVTQPECTPSRSTILTGLYPHTNGCTSNNTPLAPGFMTLPELIADEDYIAAYFGKWHLGDEVFHQQGFQEWGSIEDLYIDYYSAERNRSQRSDYHHYLLERGYLPDDNGNNTFTRKFVTKLPFEDSKTNFLAERVCDFLTEQQDHPFILYLSFFEPHSPFNGPFDNYYSADILDLPESLGKTDTSDLPYRIKALQSKYLYDIQYWKEINARYAGLVRQVDLSLGMVLDHLEKLGLNENTIIVFTSDHGEMMGAHNLLNKGVMYEEAIKVPFLISYPLLLGEDSSVINENVSLIDLVPTLLDMAGKDNSAFKKLQGHSLLPAMLNKENVTRDVFIQWNPGYLKPVEKQYPVKKLNMSESQVRIVSDQSIRTIITQDGWKLCLSDLDKCQLFNLNQDPCELNNLYYQLEYKTLIKFLSEKIFQWQQSVNDQLNLTGIQ